MTAKKKNTSAASRSSAAKKRKTKAEEAKDQELKQIIWIIVILAVTVVAYLQMGVIGIFLSRLCRFLFGEFYFIMMGVIVVQILVTMINRRSGNTSSRNPMAIILIVTALLLTVAFAKTSRNMKGFEILTDYAVNARSMFTDTPAIDVAGGILGALLLSITTFLVDWNGTILVIFVLFIIAALLLVNLEVYKQAFATISEYFSTEDDDDDDEEEDDEYDDFEEAEPVTADTPKMINGPRSVSSIRMIEADTTDDMVPVRPFEQYDAGVSRSAIDIRFDDRPVEDDSLRPYKDEPAAVQPESEPEPAGRRPVFMTVDDLTDRAKQPEAAVPEEEPAAPAMPEPPELPEYEDDYPDFEEPEYEQPVQEPPYREIVMEQEYVTPVVREAPVPETKAEVPETPRGSRPKKPYRLPKITLLDPVPARDKDDINEKAAAEKAELLIQVLRNFDIEARLIDTHIGPAVTKFEIRPDANIKVSRILGLTDDIKMQLAVRDIRIEAPIPGHNAVGVEIPNQKATPVKMKELITQIPEKDMGQPLLIVLGKDLMGNIVTCRLDKMPHLLIAGATGSGKSVCMNSIITSLLLRTKPEDVKLLLVDPKKVEFTPYQKIPHLIGPVINDPNQANNALKVIVKIMEDRYDMFSKCGVRNIQGYNDKVDRDTEPNPDGSPKPKRMPYIVVIVDEMADLMAVAGKEVEGSIQRITQLARAAGIHLIIATQRPSTDVITGVIKANIPSRIAFAVSSGIDSRTILDHIGAERLLGNGDMLYMPIGASAATRVQGVFITDDEVERITEFVSSEAIPMYDDAFIRLDGVAGNEDTAVAGAAEDPLYGEIRQYVIDVQKASTSLLQRRFGIGYNRAARMIDVLEEKGVIGPAQGSKPRDVYIKKDSE